MECLCRVLEHQLATEPFTLDPLSRQVEQVAGQSRVQVVEAVKDGERQALYWKFVLRLHLVQGHEFLEVPLGQGEDLPGGVDGFPSRLSPEEHPRVDEHTTSLLLNNLLDRDPIQHQKGVIWENRGDLNIHIG